MRADLTVLVSDEAVAGSDLIGTSYLLAQALERDGSDLGCSARRRPTGTGRWCVDRGRGTPATDSRSHAAELTVNEQTLRGKRQTEFGYAVIRRPSRLSLSRTRSTSHAILR